MFTTLGGNFAFQRGEAFLQRDATATMNCRRETAPLRRGKICRTLYSRKFDDGGRRRDVMLESSGYRPIYFTSNYCARARISAVEDICIYFKRKSAIIHNFLLFRMPSLWVEKSRNTSRLQVIAERKFLTVSPRYLKTRNLRLAYHSL